MDSFFQKLHKIKHYPLIYKFDDKILLIEYFERTSVRIITLSAFFELKKFSCEFWLKSTSVH